MSQIGRRVFHHRRPSYFWRIFMEKSGWIA
jgi:hypothetical protein